MRRLRGTRQFFPLPEFTAPDGKLGRVMRPVTPPWTSTSQTNRRKLSDKPPPESEMGNETKEKKDYTEKKIRTNNQRDDVRSAKTLRRPTSTHTNDRPTSWPLSATLYPSNRAFNAFTARKYANLTSLGQREDLRDDSNPGSSSSLVIKAYGWRGMAWRVVVLFLLPSE